MPAVRAGDVVVVTGGGRGVTAETALALAQRLSADAGAAGPHPGARPGARLADSARRPRRRSSRPWRCGPTARARRGRSRSSIGSLAASRELRRQPDAGSRRPAARSAIAASMSAMPKPFARRSPTSAATHGPIRGLIHGAGVLADRRIEDKTAEQFDQVYGTKVAGLQAMLADLSGDELKVLAFFSSITARLGPGRAGRLRRRQRGPEQAGPARSPASARVPGRVAQLGPVGRRHGHARPEAGLRSKRASA